MPRDVTNGPMRAARGDVGIGKMVAEVFGGAKRTSENKEGGDESDFHNDDSNAGVSRLRLDPLFKCSALFCTLAGMGGGDWLDGSKV